MTIEAYGQRLDLNRAIARFNGALSNPTLDVDATKDIALLIGPEGGLSEAEIQLANQAGFKNWCIGSRVLRTETAPIVALSILNYNFVL